MKVFITGATGYIGGSLAAQLVLRGHQVTGLVRSKEKAKQLQEKGIEPRLGTLDDREILINAAREADAVINAADADHAYAVTTLLPALAGTGKLFLHTSGSSLVGDKAAGEPSERVFHEDTPFEPQPEKAGRVALNRRVLAAAHEGIRSVVLVPCLIYGLGHGLNPHSIQVPWLISLARKSGMARHIGRGENIWSTIHIDDLVDAYLLATEHAPAGSLFYLENGEASLQSIAESISRMLGQGGRTESMSIDEAVREWSPEAAHFAFGSNSRVSALKARKMLGWNPQGRSVFDEIESGCYHD